MDRLPLADELPYHFYPPKLRPLWSKLGWPYIRHLLRGEQRVAGIEVAGIEHVRPLLGRGDGILLAPNHADSADGGVLFALARRLGRPTCTMAAYQLFTGMNRWLLPLIGVFPVDREGSDLKAFKAGVEILTAARYPLVVFPEGEIYHTGDRLTPLREGAAALAVTAARRIGEGKTVWIVPVGIKYRFLDGHDPTPALSALMSDLEGRFTWWPRTDKGLVDRIYAYAEAMLALKELEYHGETRPGPLKDRLAALRSHILDAMDDRHSGKRSDEPVPVRVKDLRRSCLDRLARPETTPEERDSLRRDLNEQFVAIQLYSYPGDYVRECPTLERIAEVLTKFEQDALGIAEALPRGPRRAFVRLGAPLDVGDRIRSGGKARTVVPALTADLESRMQALLDEIGPGHPQVARP